MKKNFLILILIISTVAILGFAKILRAADCRDCSGDPQCEVPSTGFGTLPTYNCALGMCSDCTQCGCVESSSDSDSSSGLFPIVQCGNEGQAPCTLCDIFETISRLMRIILLFSFAIGGGLIVVSGIMMYFGGSNPGLLKTAQTILKTYLIVFTIIHVLSGGSADTYFNLKSGGFIIECNP